jgi:hypothetical protein
LPRCYFRYIGTFYFTNRKCSGEIAADPLNRTVEVHGPCFVDPTPGFGATDCSTTLNPTIPITQTYYNPAVNADGSVNTASGQISKSGGRIARLGWTTATTRIRQSPQCFVTIIRRTARARTS